MMHDNDIHLSCVVLPYKNHHIAVPFPSPYIEWKAEHSFSINFMGRDLHLNIHWLLEQHPATKHFSETCREL